MSNDYSARLSIILPINDIENRMKIIEKWIFEVPDYIQLVLVHDRPNQLKNAGLFQKLVAAHRNTGYTEGSFNSPGISRNAGLRLARAPFVAFWDSDDLPILTNVIQMLSAIENSSFDILVGGYKKRDAESNQSKMILPNQDNWVSQVATEPGMWRMIFRSSILTDLKFTNLKLGEDQIFFLSVLERAPTVGIYSGLVYEYLCNSNQQLTSKKNFKITNLESVLQSYNWSDSVDIRRHVELVRMMHLRILISYISKLDLFRHPKKLYLITSHIKMLVCQEKLRGRELIDLMSALGKSRG